MHSVTPVADLQIAEGVSRFEGGEIAVSVFVTEFAPGRTTALHRHPYDEVFVVQSGTTRFVVGEESVIVEPGSIVTVPAGTPHGYGPAGDEPVKVLGIHPSGTVVQENLRDGIDG